MALEPLSIARALSGFSEVLARFQVTSRSAEDVGLAALAQLLGAALARDAQCFLVGNGGSAAVCSHIHNDLVNKLRLRAHVLHEPSVLTCMSNDYGYPTAFSNLVERQGRAGDVLVAISSSGKSANMLAAVGAARGRAMQVITLTGFDAANPLRLLGDANLWVPSHDYGEVEIGHLFLLHLLVDLLRQPA